MKCDSENKSQHPKNDQMIQDYVDHIRVERQTNGGGGENDQKRGGNGQGSEKRSKQGQQNGQGGQDRQRGAN